MIEIRIDDSSDPRLDDYRSLTDTAGRTRDDVEGGRYMAESFKVIERALRAGHRPRSVLTQERWLPAVRELLHDDDETPVYIAADTLVEAVAGYPVHRGALAAMHRPRLPTVDRLLREAEAQSASPRIAVLESLTDHANVGAVFRCAAALGVRAVLLSPDCADPLYRRAVRVSMGTVFQVPWARFARWPDGIDELHDAGYVVAGMTLGESAIPLDALVAESPARLALVFGTEGDGITPCTDRLLDRRVVIPMTGEVDSLNVAAAAAVAFYATRRPGEE